MIFLDEPRHADDLVELSIETLRGVDDSSQVDAEIEDAMRLVARALVLVARLLRSEELVRREAATLEAGLVGEAEFSGSLAQAIRDGALDSSKNQEVLRTLQTRTELECRIATPPPGVRIVQ